jgi:hypothetical protein
MLSMMNKPDQHHPRVILKWLVLIRAKYRSKLREFIKHPIDTAAAAGQGLMNK